MYSLFRGNVSCFLGTYYTPADEKVKVVYCKKTFFWGRVVSRAISDLCLRIFSVMDHSVHSLKASAQKSELHPRSFRAFFGSGFSACYRSLKACGIYWTLFQSAANKRSAVEPPIKRVLCTPCRLPASRSFVLRCAHPPAVVRMGTDPPP